MWWDVIVGAFTGHKQNDMDNVEESDTNVPSTHEVGDPGNMATEETAKPVDQEHSSDISKDQQGSIDAQENRATSSTEEHSRMMDPPAFVIPSSSPSHNCNSNKDLCSTAEDKQATTPLIEEETASVVLTEVATQPTEPSSPSSAHRPSNTLEQGSYAPPPSADGKQDSVMKEEEAASTTDVTAQATEPSSEPPTTPSSRTARGHMVVVEANEKQVESSSLHEDIGSAVATDVTAQLSDLPSTPTSNNRRDVLQEEDIVIVDDYDDVPEDLPTIIRTQRKGKRHPMGVSRTKSVTSKTSRYSTQTECTVLARTIAQKQEAITDSFTKIISELTTTTTTQDNKDQADDQANHKQIRNQVDETVLQQRELISQMREIISRLETDARREEAENNKLKRKLMSAKKRLGGGPPSSTKSARSLRGSKKPSPQQQQQQPVSGGEIFPISEIFCTRPLDLDELTCLFNEPPRPRRLNDEVYEF